MQLLNQGDVIRFTIEVLERLQITYMVCGSIAAGSLGRPRMTLDIDIVIQIGTSKVGELCAAFPNPEFYVSDAAARDAIRDRKQFNVIHPTSGNKVDFMILGSDEWARNELQRRCRIQLMPGVLGYSASAEDIIISKMKYHDEGGSEKHLNDSAHILAVQGDRIDRSYIEHWVKEFGLTVIWNAIIQRVGANSREP